MRVSVDIGRVDVSRVHVSRLVDYSFLVLRIVTPSERRPLLRFGTLSKRPTGPGCAGLQYFIDLSPAGPGYSYPPTRVLLTAEDATEDQALSNGLVELDSPRWTVLLAACPLDISTTRGVSVGNWIRPATKPRSAVDPLEFPSLY